MGADIHVWAEVKNEQTGEWEAVRKEDKKFQDEYYPLWAKQSQEEGKPIPDWVEQYTDHPYDNRNYDLFGILANVRNGYGFGGVSTGEGFNYIDEPRGVPDDVSDYVRQQVEEWEEAGHSHSYFTVAELLAFDWDQVTRREGVITATEYSEWEAGSRPRSWSNGVLGEGSCILLPDQYERAKANGELEQDTDYYVRVLWTESYRECVGTFLTKTIPELQALGSEENVRIVFFFDN